MKHKDYLSLNYDGRAEQEIKTKKTHVYQQYLKEINGFAKELSMKFPEVKDIFFVEVAKRGFEVAYKKSIDSATRDITINLFDKIADTENFVEYMKAIKVGRYLTKKLTITYIDPIKKGKNGTTDSIRSNEQLKDAPVKTIVIEAGQLLGLIEESLANHLKTEGLNEVNKIKKAKPSLFGKDNITDERFNAQYARAACQEIFNYIEPSKSELEIKKEICVLVLEHHRLIERFVDYDNRKRQEQIISNDHAPLIKRSTWISRTFSLYNKRK